MWMTKGMSWWAGGLPEASARACAPATHPYLFTLLSQSPRLPLNFAAPFPTVTYLCRTQLWSPLCRHQVRSRPPKSPRQTSATVTTASQASPASQPSPKHTGTTP